METGDEKWSFHIGYELDFPSEEELKTMKYLIIPGSCRSVYDSTVSWIPAVKEYIRRVFNDYPHIKIFGGCFGEQITAQTMGGNVERMPPNPERPKIIGREQVKFTDEFYELDWVKRYMEKNDLTRDTLTDVTL